MARVAYLTLHGLASVSSARKCRAKPPASQLLPALTSAPLTASEPAHVLVPATLYGDSSSATPATTASAPAPAPSVHNVWDGQSSFQVDGTTGVTAMQLAVVDNDSVLILDKAEHNPLQINGHPAWGQWINLATGESRAIDLQSNSFCGGGAFLSNGSLVSFGGDPTIKSDLGNTDGLQSLRIFDNCNDSGCSVYDNPAQLHMTGPRWYPGGARLPDGSIMIAGGMKGAGYTSSADLGNPTFEFFPPKGDGQAVHSQFMVDTLPSNLFPIVHVLPSGKLFMAANNMAQIYDWQANTEQRLPNFAWRVGYPWSAAASLLPLTPENNYTPTMLFCGGSNQDDSIPPNLQSAQGPTVAGCAVMDITDAGIAGGWQTQDSLPEGRTMGEPVLLPDGKLLILNGAETGSSGAADYPDDKGQSNADHPILHPVLYDPTKPLGQRISNNLPSAQVPRMYHSSATLLPDGRVMIAGSNPHNSDTDVVQNIPGDPWNTEYRIEYFSPPYMSMDRPSFTGLPAVMAYGGSFQLQVQVPAGITADRISVALMDLGFSTHSVAMDRRYLGLKVQSLDGNTLTVTGPPTVNLYPPGVGFLFVLVDGVPSRGQKTLVGGMQPGQAPPVNKLRQVRRSHSRR